MLSRIELCTLEWERCSPLQKKEQNQRCGKQSMAVLRGESTGEVSELLWEPLLHDCGYFPPILRCNPSDLVVGSTEAAVPRGVQAATESAL